MPDKPGPMGTKEVVPIELMNRIKAENAALRRTLEEAARSVPKPWFKQWKRWGAVLAVLLPIVNGIIGSPLDAGIVTLVVCAIIAWCGLEMYKDQKIAVAKTMKDMQIDVKRLEAATAPMFKNLLTKIREGAKPPGPPK